MRFVDLETAKGSKRLRLVLLKGVPSPWSQAAKAIFEIKQLDALGVWQSAGDQAIQAWTGVVNAPAALYADEPVRAHWADILALAERLAPSPALLPADVEQRMLAFGLCNEIMGQGGLLWNMRLMLIELSMTSQGARGYSLPVAQYLGARYGYADVVPGASEARVAETLRMLAERLERGGGPYYFGSELSAVDVYSTAAIDTLSPLPHEDCPMHPKSRAAFEARRDSAKEPVPERLLAHRDFMHRTHIPLPLEC